MIEEKVPLHPKIGKEVKFKPTYCVIQTGDGGKWSGIPSYVTAKIVDYHGRKDVHLHIRLMVTEGKGHEQLEKPIQVDIDNYCEKEQFFKAIERLIGTRQVSLG